MKTFDPATIDYYREKSATGLQFRGLSILEHAADVGRLIAKTKSRTVLDYGCGRGDQYKVNRLHQTWSVPMPTLYDPGNAIRDKKPEGRFDFVICSDVLEHVEEEFVDAVIADLFAYATKFVWLSVCCRPAKKSFPDGRNLHLTIRPPEWWTEKVKAHAGETPFKLVFTK